MRRTLLLVLILCIAAFIGPAELVAQENPALAELPWWLRVVYFIVALPYTLWLVFVEGGRMHLLPAPLLGMALILWSFREWSRQKFWTPRLVHIMAVLALATIILINVDWVMAGGEMWTQRYVVIAVFGIFPYVAYLVFLGPKFLGRRRAPTARAAEPDAGWASPPVPRPERSMTPFYIGVGVILVLGLGVVGSAMRSAASSGPASTPRPDLAPLRTPEALVERARGVEIGDPDAPLTIVEFGDFQCPACGAFALRFKPELESTFVETGRARFVFIDLPLVSMHGNAFLAARAARCAEDQGAFWAYHDELFRNQDAWSDLASPYATFGEYAAAIGIDVADFGACLASQRHTAVVEANAELASKLNINSTPSIIVIPETGDPRRAENYRFATIAAAVAEATEAPAGN